MAGGNYSETAGGSITETVDGDYNIYAGRNITNTAGKSVLESGANKGVKFGAPKSPPHKKGIVDVVMFVAGTTDPLNIAGLKHQANTTYWQDGLQSFWEKTKELAPQYLDLHVEGSFFSWSGANNTEERNKAADRLLDLLMRVYPAYKNHETHLHLIGHSHGGNVINQFTNLIVKDQRFPKLWKIKSITYLSTPFFKKKHQLNHTKLHKECKVINVHNEYDLTQRLIADFSLVELVDFLRDFHMDNFSKGLNVLKGVDTSAFNNLKHIWISESEGTFLWGETTKAFSGLNILMNEFIKYIKGININVTSLSKERDILVGILNNISQWTNTVQSTFSRNSVTREGGYGHKQFLQDLSLTSIVKVLNLLFDIKTGVNDSYILTFLARVFAENGGVTDSIEVNSWSPAEQASGLSIQDVNITTHDPYHSRGKKAICEGFISGAAGAMQRNNLEELLMRLCSQFVTPKTMTIIYYALDATEFFVGGDLDTQVKKLRMNMGVYENLVTKYHADLVAKKDETDFPEIIKRPGSIPYLATVSHGLSHTQFWPEVESGLKGAFSSGVNPGYKKK